MRVHGVAHDGEGIGLRKPVLEGEHTLMDEEREPVGGVAAESGGGGEQRGDGRAVDRVVDEVAAGEEGGVEDGGVPFLEAEG